ncbi:MAG: glycosyltransferase family 2 protein [Candidatus Wildermuthbacteria bacterium]|nr:glycosyltransferase family 2 protein [Candidatus Wildermuthbacteria bacterium]
MNTLPASYLHIGKAADLADPGDRRLFRFFEILPGLLSWGTLLGSVIFSWLFPSWTAFFMMAFVVYWVLRMLYFLFYLAAGYRKMRRHEKKDWLRELSRLNASVSPLGITSWKDVYHLVIMPSYKEPLEVLRASFSALARTRYPKDRIIVVLGIEQREGQEARDKAAVLLREFGSSFFHFLVTEHPQDILGEITGKGSNESFAARAAKTEIIDALKIPYNRVIVSSLDADTVVFPQYFSCLSWHYIAAKHPTRTSFQPIPLYINNIWQAPPISRVFAFSSTFWHTMNQQRPEKLITFSSHAMSFSALVDVGFKAVNVVSDDSRIFWQCFFKYHGDYRVESLHYPVSMDANVAPRLFGTMKNIYRQHRRWAYGCGEIAYAFFGFVKDKSISRSRKFSLGFELLESHWSWATSSILLFMLGHLPSILGGEEFSRTLLSYNLPRFTSDILTISMIGVVMVAALSISLLPPRKPSFGKLRVIWFGAQWFILPFVMIFFMALPALEAQTRWMLGRYLGFWVTPKTRR